MRVGLTRYDTRGQLWWRTTLHGGVERWRSHLWLPVEYDALVVRPTNNDNKDLDLQPSASTLNRLDHEQLSPKIFQVLTAN
ncbi:hypothetical protein WH47_09947 [Habropoda laboriosa]|uniref:Uncharacterized protein n=1 Tax=Habropoda laboriosa TaxID=597456 RepID=A0A0L7R3G5_9HYME|nr:hypothetical protein WH47_09947 [Habropoda laboriosa]